MMHFKYTKYKNIIEMAGLISFRQVARALKFHYPSPVIKKATLKRYQEIMLEISKYKPEETPGEELIITMSRPYTWKTDEGELVNGDMPGEEYYHVSMKKKGEDVNYGIDFCRWEIASSWKISEDTMKHYTPGEILAHFLWEITFCGWTQAPIQRRMKALEKMAEEIKTGKAKLVK